MEKICKNINETLSLAKDFARQLRQASRAIVLFNGPMGAGKTTFISAVAKCLAPETKPSSPTFTIINQYAENIFHIDLYRIDNERDLGNTAFYEILAGDNFVFIEWAERLTRIPRGRIFNISIEPLDGETRRFIIS